MKMRYRGIWKAAAMVFPAILFFGCSNLTSGSAPCKSGHILPEAEMARFASEMRPCQKNAESHYALASYYQKRNRDKEAIAEFQKVILINPGDVRAYNGLGFSHARLRDFLRAIESYRAAIRLSPGSGYLHNNLGYSYILQENYSAAIKSLKRAVRFGCKDNQVHNNLGMAYAMTGQHDLALSEFEMGRKKVDAHYSLACILEKKGMFKEAEDHYRICLEMDSSLVFARKRLRDCEIVTRASNPRTTVESKGKKDTAVKGKPQSSENPNLQCSNEKSRSLDGDRRPNPQITNPVHTHASSIGDSYYTQGNSRNGYIEAGRPFATHSQTMALCNQQG